VQPVRTHDEVEATRRGAARSNRTWPPGEIAVIESPKTYSTSSRAAS
jgi:hypothetical protein